MAGIDSLQKGAYHIANNTVEYNPQRKSNFTLVVTGLDNLPRVGSAEDDTENRISDAQNQIIIALKSCDVPKVAIGKSEINVVTQQSSSLVNLHLMTLLSALMIISEAMLKIHCWVGRTSHTIRDTTTLVMRAATRKLVS